MSIVPKNAESTVTAASQTDHSWEWLVRAIVWLLAVEYAVYWEAARLRERLTGVATTGWWMGNPDPDATFILPWLLLAPFCFRFPLMLSDVQRWLPPIDGLFQFTWTPARERTVTCLSVTLLSVAMNWSVSQCPVPTVPEKRFGDIGPYIHDEFSYLLQADTYLAGRLWWPGHERARELFHQMHVLNEDKFASRYFPGTGAWLAPFVAVGWPVGASWLAGALAANLAAAIVRRSHGFCAGSLAGILVAVAPGNCVINNLLLAHGPTLVGMLTCLYAFRRLFEALDWKWAAVAGGGLALAMLSRPLTAACMALPFGVWWFAQCAIRDESYRRQWWSGTFAMGLPLLIGIGILGWQNSAITGKITLTPYSQYNRLYTPRHVFAFRENGESVPLSPQQHLKEFDYWAQPLTWELALANLEKRLKGSFAWSLGVIPLGMAAVYLLLNWSQQSPYDRLLLASILCLHLGHMPYWLAGIMNYHYVFESGTLWLMLLAGVVVKVIRGAIVHGRLLTPLWIAGCLLLCEAINYLPIAPGGTVPRVKEALRLVTNAAGRYERFRETLDSSDLHLPAVVLVKTSAAADLHSEYVRNRAPFDAPVLVGRYRPEIYSDAELNAIFPDRHLYVYEAESGDLRRLESEESDNDRRAERVP